MRMNLCYAISMLGNTLKDFFGFPTILPQPHEGGIIFIISILEVKKQTWREKSCS